MATTPPEQMIWRYKPRGGYNSDQGGWDMFIPVTILRRGPVRVLVEVPLRRGGTVQRWVHPDSLQAPKRRPPR